MERRRRFGVMLAIQVIGLTVGIVTGSSLARDPSPEQCTCDVPGTTQRTGAQVVNAGSCVLDPRYPWCDIYLGTLENTSAQSELVSRLQAIPKPPEPGTPDAASQIIGIIMPMFTEYSRTQAAENGDLLAQYQQDQEQIHGQIIINKPELMFCLAAYAKREPTTREGDKVKCSVGTESRWLRIQFNIRDHAYIFLFSPNH